VNSGTFYTESDAEVNTCPTWGFSVTVSTHVIPWQRIQQSGVATNIHRAQSTLGLLYRHYFY